MPKEKEVKHHRRTLLKFALFGGGALIFGKLFGSITNLFTDKVIKQVDFNNFKFTETTKSLTIFDKGGEPLLIVDKEGVSD